MVSCLKDVDGLEDTFVDKLLALGIISVLDLEEVNEDPLVEELGLEREMAKKIVDAATEEAKLIASERSKKQAEDLMEQEEEKLQKSEGQELGLE